MSNPDNIVYADIDAIITERNQIRERWRVSQTEAGQLNAQSVHIPQQVSLEPVSPLTASKTPPDELGALPPLLGNALTQITQIKAQIAEEEKAVQNLKNTNLILIASLVVVGLIVVLVLAHAIHLF